MFVRSRVRVLLEEERSKTRSLLRLNEQLQACIIKTRTLFVPSTLPVHTQASIDSYEVASSVQGIPGTYV